MEKIPVFVPAIGERKNGPNKHRALKKISNNLFKASAIAAIIQAGSIAVLPFTGHVFTSDQRVIKLVVSLIPVHLAISALHGVFCASEGILLGLRDLSFIGRAYGLYSIAVPYFLLKVKRAALAGSARATLGTVWEVFLGYVLVRFAMMSGRLWMNERRIARADKGEESA